MDAQQTWEQRAQSKRCEILSRIPQQWRIQHTLPSAAEQPGITQLYFNQYLSAQEIEITECDAALIATKTTTGKWTALQVTQAFCHRAALAHQYVNCLHEIFFSAAFEDARRLDAFYATHQRPVGPLHGVPVSLKDQFHIRGVETTMGYVGWIGASQCDDSQGESELVRELRALGAVLYCKTSVSTALMAPETANSIIGYTWNPHNRLLSAGGSSGGEGALLACKGSPLGFGTDIGGSIRVPSAFNGLYGLRPSTGRLPYEGAANSMDGQNTILSVIGPMAPSVASLRLAMKSVLSQQPWLHDPLIVPLPWRDNIEQEMRSMLHSARDRSKVTFAMYEHDGMVRPHPPVLRALRRVRDILMNLGHEIIDWNPPPHSHASSLAGDILTMDGGHDITVQRALSGEPLLPQLYWLRKVEGREKNATEINALNVAKRQWQKDYLDYWNHTADRTASGRAVDALICPTTITAAVLPGQFVHPDWTFFVNVLDATAVTVPVGFADKGVDVLDPTLEPLNEQDAKIAAQYDPDLYNDAPVGLQLVGRRYDEEKILVVAEYLGAAIGSVDFTHVEGE